MYRFVSSGSSVSIIWVMRSIPSVVTFRTWVSPRWNRLEARASLRDPSSHHPLLELLPRGRDLCGAGGVGLLAPGLEQVGLDLILQRVEGGFALDLVGHDRTLEPGAGERVDRLEGLVRVEGAGRPRALGHPDGVHELELEVDHLVDRRAGGLEALGHDLLGRRGDVAAGLEERPRVVRRLALDHQDVDRALVG